MKLNFLDRFSKNTGMGRQTDRQTDTTKLTVTFYNSMYIRIK
jgi:hypothetical protein